MKNFIILAGNESTARIDYIVNSQRLENIILQNSIHISAHAKTLLYLWKSFLIVVNFMQSAFCGVLFFSVIFLKNKYKKEI